MNNSWLKKINLPDSPGVYLFKMTKHLIRSNGASPTSNRARILYIGKATSLRNRVKSYFAHDLLDKRSPLIADMVSRANKIDFIKTDSVLEALILEAELIKKYQPKHNTKEKDDKSYNYVIITKEDFPRVLIERGKNLKSHDPKKLQATYGPFTNGSQLKDALKIIRKIFPFRDRCKLHQNRPCFNYQIGLCPGTCIGAVSKNEYGETIKNIELFFKGKKKSILKNLQKEMKTLAKGHEFEKANKIKKMIFALNHIQDIALIKSEFSSELSQNDLFRIEAYDVAHISGTSTVGVMVVVENSFANKAEYRKFKINNSIQNDVAALKEMLERRLKHTEWRFPDVIAVDGGVAQKNIAEKAVKGVGLNIDVVAVTKDEKHRPKSMLGKSEVLDKYKKDIILANSEAHRFAISYHKNLRNRNTFS